MSRNRALFFLALVYGLTDEAGALKEAYQYDAYGKQTVITDGNDGDTIVNFGANDVRTAGGNSTFTNPYMFTGQRFDPETGIMFYKNRYYSFDLGRFLSRDPIGYRAGPALYEYVGDSPTGYTDPLGLQPAQRDDGGAGGGGAPVPAPAPQLPPPWMADAQRTQNQLTDELQRCRAIPDAKAREACTKAAIERLGYHRECKYLMKKIKVVYSAPNEETKGIHALTADYEVNVKICRLVLVVPTNQPPCDTGLCEVEEVKLMAPKSIGPGELEMQASYTPVVKIEGKTYKMGGTDWKGNAISSDSFIFRATPGHQFHCPRGVDLSVDPNVFLSAGEGQVGLKGVPHPLFGGISGYTEKTKFTKDETKQ